MSEAKKNTWGGKRAGAGAKKKPRAPKPDLEAFLDRVPPETAAELVKPHAEMIVDALLKIVAGAESEPARVSAARVLLEHAYGKPGAVQNAPETKKEQTAKAAEAAGSGRFAPPPPPRGSLN